MTRDFGFPQARQPHRVQGGLRWWIIMPLVSQLIQSCHGMGRSRRYFSKNPTEEEQSYSLWRNWHMVNFHSGFKRTRISSPTLNNASGHQMRKLLFIFKWPYQNWRFECFLNSKTKASSNKNRYTLLCITWNMEGKSIWLEVRHVEFGSILIWNLYFVCSFWVWKYRNFALTSS